MDTRFFTRCDSIPELLETIDIDSVDELETLLMHLFARPIKILESDNDDPGAAIEIVVWGRCQGAEQVIGGSHEFPLSLEDIARSTLPDLDDQEFGPYPGAPARPRTADDLVMMGDAQLERALRDALVAVRVMNSLDQQQSGTSQG